MSKLHLSNSQQEWTMNVTNFQSGLYSQIDSAQVKLMTHHYPIKVTQPDITFNVIFSSEKQFETFQRFIRAVQQQALATVPAQLLNFMWPERNINNFTGVIKKFVAGGQRFNPAPQASFTVDLVDSFVSARTELANHNLLWETEFVNGYLIYGGASDGVLGLPTQSEINQFPGLGGATTGPWSTLPNAATPIPSGNFAQSGPGAGPGILNGSGLGIGTAG